MHRALPLLLALLAAAASAQPRTPEPGPVFDDSRLPTVHVEIHPDTLAWILDPANAQSNVEYRARFVWDDGLERDTVEEVGFRLRGNTSRDAAKKSFKVSFNTYVQGREWQGLDKLNLNGEHNDPTILRAKLAWGLLRDAGVPGSRAGMARLMINDADFGVYANVEHVDEEFLGERFRDPDGALFKCLYPADLDYLGSNPDTYRSLAPFGRPVYELVQGESDYAELAAFITALNLTPLGQLPEVIEEHLDVNGYLRALALDVLMGNWDGYAYNQNNFYLYHDPEIGRFRYIPYDLDNTFGIDFLGRDWGTRDVYDWPQGSTTGAPPRPLAKRLLQVPDYRDRFTFYLRRAMEEVYTTTALYPHIDALRDLIADAAEVDPYRPQDYGWSAEDFYTSFDTALGGHVDYGLKPFISTRRSAALSQADVVDVAPLLSDLRIVEPVIAPNIALAVRVWAEDEKTPAAVVLHTSVGGAWTSRAMTAEGDGVYEGTMGPFEPGAEVQYYVAARDILGQSRTEPRGGAEAPASFTVPASGPAGIVINEFMASNDATISDAAGDFDDWIELYNAGSEPISLAGYFLTDDLSDPNEFALPDSVIAPGAFVLVWADNDDDQGPMHASFRLSASGETVALFTADGEGGFTFVDGTSFGPQETDESYGRVGDGSGPWSRFADPTPGATNTTATTASPAPLAAEVRIESVAPNPFREGFQLRLAPLPPGTVHLEIFDALGRRVGSQRVSVTDAPLDWRTPLPAGVYVARVTWTGRNGKAATATTRVTALQ